MALSGEEKKLQALFSELKAADDQAAPRFATIWNRAQLLPRRMRTFNPAFAGVTALILCTLISLAVWSRYSSRNAPQQPKATAGPSPTSVDHAPSTGSPNVAVATDPVKPGSPHRNSEAKRVATQRQTQLLAADRRTKQDAKMMGNWKSPTTALLSSPSGEIFSSLPQVNQNSSDLKSFLNRSN